MRLTRVREPSLRISKSAAIMATPAVSAPVVAPKIPATALAPASSASSTWEAVTSYADSHPQVASALIGGGGSLFVGAITLTGVAMTLAHAQHKMKRELQAQRDRSNEERA